MSTVANGRSRIVRVLTAASAAMTATELVSSADKPTARETGRRPMVLAGTGALISRPSLSAFRPEALHDSAEDSRAHASQGDLGDQHHGHQSNQPWPEVECQPRLVPIDEEGVVRIAQDAASRKLGEFAKHRLVHTQVPEFLPVWHDQTGQLGADHLLAATLSHPHQVDALVRCWEPPAIAPWPDLLQVDHGACFVRRDDANVRVQEVDELTLRVDRVDEHLARLVRA